MRPPFDWVFPREPNRRANGPCPGLRPGRFGWAFRWPLENGAADRCCERFNCSISSRSSSIRCCCFRISAINSSRLNDSKSAIQHSVPIPFYTQALSLGFAANQLLRSLFILLYLFLAGGSRRVPTRETELYDSGAVKTSTVGSQGRCCTCSLHTQ